MATKKSASKSKDESVSAPIASAPALRHGLQAEGARYLKPGFAIDPDYDLAFALGYPHFRTLEDGGDDDDASLVAAVNTISPYTRPRGVASRLARLLAFGVYQHPTTEIVLEWEGKPVAARGPLSEQEGRALVLSRLSKESMFVNEHDLALVLEAVIGPDALVDVIVEGLETLPEAAWRARNRPGQLYAHYLGFGLLRIPPAEAARQRKRLERIYQRARVTLGEAPSQTLEALDCALHGAEGAQRSGGHVGEAIDGDSLLHVLDDPEFVATNVIKQPTDYPIPDVRLVFLGGERVLDVYAKLWRKLRDADELAQFAHGVGAIRSPKALSIVLEIAAKSKAKKAASAWLAAHAEYVRPFLEETAKGSGDPAAWAAAELKKLK